MNAATKSPKPFASLTAAINAVDVGDLCGDLAFLAEEATTEEATLINEAVGALRCAETVETMSDFVVNLREAATALTAVKDAKQVSAAIARALARCV